MVCLAKTLSGRGSYLLTAVDYSNGDYYHYTYDAVGNRLTQTSMVNGLSSVVDYMYDDVNRLTNVNSDPSAVYPLKIPLISKRSCFYDLQSLSQRV